MKRKIVISSQYKKDIKLARRRNLPEEELNEIVLSLPYIERRVFRMSRMSHTTGLASDI